MSERHIDALIVPTGDYHLSEYCASYFCAREFITGFTGSAGTAVITADDAGLWTDSRYYLQAADELKGSGVTLYKMQEPGVVSIPDYIKQHAGAAGDQAAGTDGVGSRNQRTVAFDGRIVSCGTFDKWKRTLEPAGFVLREDVDLIGEIWQDRPALPCHPVSDYPVDYAGKSRRDKLAEVSAKMAERKADALFLSSLSDIAWLLDLRGSDVHCNPVFLAYLLIESATPVSVTLFAQESAFSPELTDTLKNDGIRLKPYDSVGDALKALDPEKTLWLPVEETSCGLRGCVPAAMKLITKPGPTVLMKAVKNEVEQDNSRKAHLKDAVAVNKWLFWLKSLAAGADNTESMTDPQTGKAVTEIGAADKLEAFRAQQEHFMGNSFDPIVAYADHAAIVHYSPSEESDVPLKKRGLLLADTGGQYLEGTTDITRTIALGPVTEEERTLFTAVLRGHIAIARTRFPKGISGANLDVLAHAPLWDMGRDYGHGTGHGVGHYLNVHEGPNAFRWKSVSGHLALPAFEAGMITSDEPGYYEAGKFGIRHESLLVCVPDQKTEYGDFLKFEELTLAPFDLDAIDPSMLDMSEKAWLNAYHETVFNAVAPFLDSGEKAWLKDATRAIL